MKIALAGLLIALSTAAHAESQATVPASISALGFLAGSWGSASNGTTMEVHYSTPAAGTILNTERMIAGGQVVFFEFERILELNGTIVLQPSPNGVPGVSFTLSELSAQKAVFSNPEHDFPRDIVLSLDSDGQLHQRVTGMQGGQVVDEEFVLVRQ